MAGFVTERDIVELDLAAHPPERARIGPILDLRIDLQQLEASAQSRLRAFDLAVGLKNLVHRRVERGEVSREHDQVAD